MAETLTKIPRHLSFYVAALALAALVIGVAVMTAGPAEAQRTGDNGEAYKKFGVIPCTEEEEPDDRTVPTVGRGYYAIFDAFWDYEDGHPSNNFCPPRVTVQEDLGEETYTRHEANIHISETDFSIPDSYRVKVVDSGVVNGNPSTETGPKIDLAKFPFMKNGNAVSAVKTENGSTVFAHNEVWWVKVDGPGTSPLQVGYSTALLEEADWYKDENDDDVAEPPVRFEFEAVHVFKDGREYKGSEAHEIGAHMFAFDPGSTQTNAQWSSVDTDTNEVRMFTGQYRPLQFVFTEPGSYLFQVHFKGHVRKEGNRLSTAPENWEPISPDDIITSPVQWYTFHVGPQAGLSTAITAGAVSGNDVPLTVTAANRGPDTAENVEVEINLPLGLSAPATLPTGASSNSCGVVSWEVGSLSSGATRTLRFSATAEPGAAGKRTVTSQVHSTTFDPDTTDNDALGDATLAGTAVRAPFFPGVSRDIVEHAVAGAHAGDPVAANNPDIRALTYTLSGRCSDWFQAHSNGQIVLAANKTLNYDKQWEFPLTLHVSDGVNASGTTDSTIDDSMPVTIRVEDTDPTVHPTLTITHSPENPTKDQSLTLTATVSNLPGSITSCSWTEIDYGVSAPGTINGAVCTVPASSSDTYDVLTYSVHIKWQGGGISGSTSVRWRDAQ